MITVFIITVLILLNGLFVAAEFAIVGAPRAAIKRSANQGNRIARMVHRILSDPRSQDMYIATAQLGITIASLGLGMYGEHVLAKWIGNWLGDLGTPGWLASHAVASVCSVTILTYFHIVIGEMIPKSIALQQAEDTALWVTPPMRWAMILLYPLVIVLNGLGNGFLKLIGIDRQTASHHHYHAAEELQYIVEESLEGGLLRAESGKVLQELFEFGDLKTGEIMVPRVKVIGIPLGATHQELKRVLSSSPHTRYPVYNGDLDHIVGIVHIKDILRQLLVKGQIQKKDVHQVPYLPETTELDRVLEAMHRARTHMVIVMDEHGGTSGLITIEDLFEEVIGEIEEDALQKPEIYRDSKGKLYVAGTVRVEEIGEYLNVDLQHDEVDTVSGLVLAVLGSPPKVDETVTYNNVIFKVISVEGHGVEECIVTLEKK